MRNRIKDALILKEMKQVELCEKTGISKTSINGWVKNNWQPKKDALYKMAKALDVNELWLAGYDVPLTKFNISPSGNNQNLTVVTDVNNSPPTTNVLEVGACKSSY